MTEPAERDPVRTFVGGAMMAVGALVMVLCGLCTATVMIAALVPGGDRSFFVMALFIGGVPTGIGVALFLVGRNILRRDRAPESAE